MRPRARRLRSASKRRRAGHRAPARPARWPRRGTRRLATRHRRAAGIARCTSRTAMRCGATVRSPSRAGGTLACRRCVSGVPTRKPSPRSSRNPSSATRTLRRSRSVCTTNTTTDTEKRPKNGSPTSSHSHCQPPRSDQVSAWKPNTAMKQHRQRDQPADPLQERLLHALGGLRGAGRPFGGQPFLERRQLGRGDGKRVRLHEEPQSIASRRRARPPPGDRRHRAGAVRPGQAAGRAFAKRRIALPRRILHDGAARRGGKRRKEAKRREKGGRDSTARPHAFALLRHPGAVGENESRSRRQPRKA
jgi:hypothetical protein